jgi:dCMP deaminase
LLLTNKIRKGETKENQMTMTHILFHELPKWDQRFLELSKLVSSWSKDPSTQVGACVVDDQHRIVGLGFNGFPRGVQDCENYYNDKEKKYEIIVHAEVNAILNSNKPTAGCTLYSTLFPCPRCASVIIQSGIRKVVAFPFEEKHQTFHKHFHLTIEMFDHAGVEICLSRT